MTVYILNKRAAEIFSEFAAYVTVAVSRSIDEFGQRRKGRIENGRGGYVEFGEHIQQPVRRLPCGVITRFRVSRQGFHDEAVVKNVHFFLRVAIANGGDFRGGGFDGIDMRFVYHAGYGNVAVYQFVV